MQATIDIFNLFNFQAADAARRALHAVNVLPVVNGDIERPRNTADGTPFNPAEKNPNFGRVTNYQPPRIFRFGLRVEF